MKTSFDRSQFLNLLEKGEVDGIFRLCENHNQKKSFRSLFKKNPRSRDQPFSLAILCAGINEKLVPKDYSKVKALDFESDFVEELVPLFRIFFLLHSTGKDAQLERILASTLLACGLDAAIHIQKSSNGYPQNSIFAKTWMDGAALREWMENLEGYFIQKNEIEDALEASLIKTRLTLSVMAHYPDIIGPDMVSIAEKYEQLNNPEEAKRYYAPVVQDLGKLIPPLAEFEDHIYPDEIEQELAMAKSLLDAMEGLERLGEKCDSELVERTREYISALVGAQFG